MATVDVGIVSTGTGAGLGKLWVWEVVTVVTLLFSSEVLTDGVLGVAPNAMGGSDSISYEANVVVETTHEGADFNVNTTPGVATDECS